MGRDSRNSHKKPHPGLPNHERSSSTYFMSSYQHSQDNAKYSLLCNTTKVLLAVLSNIPGSEGKPIVSFETMKQTLNHSLNLAGEWVSSNNTDFCTITRDNELLLYDCLSYIYKMGTTEKFKAIVEAFLYEDGIYSPDKYHCAINQYNQGFLDLLNTYALSPNSTELCSGSTQIVPGVSAWYKMQNISGEACKLFDDEFNKMVTGSCDSQPKLLYALTGIVCFYLCYRLLCSSNAKEMDRETNKSLSHNA